MKKRERLFFNFFLCFTAAIFVLGLSKLGFLASAQSLLQKAGHPLQSTVFSVFNGVSIFAQSQKQQENKELLFKKIVDQKKLMDDNKALRDQFATTEPKPAVLIPAHVIGTPTFLPGITSVEALTIDKGSQDGIKTGQAVVYKNNLVGKIEKTTSHLSSVLLITNNRSSFAGYTTQTNALGVVKGKGRGEMLFNNVVLSDNLIISDVVLTHGDLDTKGLGFPKDLIVGNISSVDKKPSSLFQSAQIKSVLDFARLSMVFVSAK